MKERLYFVKRETVEFFGEICRMHNTLTHLSDVVVERDGDRWKCIKHTQTHYLNENCHPNWIKLLFSQFHVYSLTPRINLDKIKKNESSKTRFSNGKPN
jgi:hypothetical protein